MSNKFQKDVATCINEAPDLIAVKFMHGIEGSVDRFVLRAISPVWRAQMQWGNKPFSLEQITQVESDRIQCIWLGEVWKIKLPLTMEQILRLMLIVDEFQISELVLDKLRFEFETGPVFPADIRAICDNETLVGNLPKDFANAFLLPRIIELAPDTIRSPAIAALVNGHALDSTGLLWNFKDKSQPEKVMQILLTDDDGFTLQCNRLEPQHHSDLKATTLYALDDTRRVLCAVNDDSERTVVLELDIIAGKILNCRRLDGQYTVRINATDLFAVRDDEEEFEIGVYDLETFFQSGAEADIITFVNTDEDQSIGFRIVDTDRFCVFADSSMSMFVRDPQSARYKEAWDKLTGLTCVRHAQYLPDRVLLSGFCRSRTLYLKLLGPGQTIAHEHRCGKVIDDIQCAGTFCVVDGLVYQHIWQYNSVEVLNATDLSPVQSIAVSRYAPAHSLMPHGPVILAFDCTMSYERIVGICAIDIRNRAYVKTSKDICKLHENHIVDFATMSGKLIAMDMQGVVYVLSREEITE